MKTKARLLRENEMFTTVLKSIHGGSAFAGRWLDEDGDEVGEDALGASWVGYTLEEQAAWMEVVARLAGDALANAEAK